MEKKELIHHQCSRCHTWRISNLFLNDKGRRLKTCEVCRTRYKCKKGFKDTFKQHIESQFADGMSWENVGEWQFDYIRPLKSCTSLDEIVDRLSYLNVKTVLK